MIKTSVTLAIDYPQCQNKGVILHSRIFLAESFENTIEFKFCQKKGLFFQPEVQGASL